MTEQKTHSLIDTFNVEAMEREYDNMRDVPRGIHEMPSLELFDVLESISIEEMEVRKNFSTLKSGK